MAKKPQLLGSYDRHSHQQQASSSGSAAAFPPHARRQQPGTARPSIMRSQYPHASNPPGNNSWRDREARIPPISPLRGGDPQFADIPSTSSTRSPRDYRRGDKPFNYRRPGAAHNVDASSSSQSSAPLDYSNRRTLMYNNKPGHHHSQYRNSYTAPKSSASSQPSPADAPDGWNQRQAVDNRSSPFRDYQNMKRPRMMADRPRLLSEPSSASAGGGGGGWGVGVSAMDVDEDIATSLAAQSSSVQLVDSAKAEEEAIRDRNAMDDDIQSHDSANDDDDSDNSESEKEEEAEKDRDDGMTKEGITASMDQLDDEISKYESMLEALQLKKKESEMQQARASRPTSPVFAAPSSPMMPKQADDILGGSSRWNRSASFEEIDLVQRIYKENRSKIKKYTTLPQLKLPASVKSPVPLYTKPSDLPFYEENLKKHAVFRGVLIKYLREKETALWDKIEDLASTFNDLDESWHESIAKWENSQRKKQDKILGKNAIKKRAQLDQHEDPLMNHPAAGDYDPTVLPFAYLGPEEDFRYLKTLSKVPDMLFDDVEISALRFVNNNRLFEDSSLAIRNRNNTNPWSVEEKQIFLTRFLEFPKEFGRISAYLPNKTAQDCVLFYYLNKKSLKLKSLTKQAINIRNKILRRARAETTINERAPGLMSGIGYRNEDHLTISHTSVTQRSNSVVGAPYPSQTVPAGRYIEFEESQWENEDLQKTKELFLDVGKDFRKIAEMLGTRTILQVRNLYLAYKIEMGIDLTSAESIADGGTRNERKRGKQLREIRGRQGSSVSLAQSESVVSTPVLPHQEIPTLKQSPSVEKLDNPKPVVKAPVVKEKAVVVETQVQAPQEKKKGKRGRPAGKTSKPKVTAPPPVPPTVQDSAPETDEAPAQVHPPGSPSLANSNDPDGKRERKRNISYWTAKEKLDFVKFFPQHGKNWRALSECIPTKSEIQIRNYYQNHKISLGLVESKRIEREDEYDKVGEPDKQADSSARESASEAETTAREDSAKEETPRPPIMMYPPMLAPNVFPYPYPPHIGTDGTLRYPPFAMYPHVYPHAAGRPPYMPSPFHPGMYAIPQLAQMQQQPLDPNAPKSQQSTPPQPQFLHHMPYGPMQFAAIAPQPMGLPPQQYMEIPGAGSSLDTLAKIASNKSPRVPPILPREEAKPELQQLPPATLIAPTSVSKAKKLEAAKEEQSSAKLINVETNAVAHEKSVVVDVAVAGEKVEETSAVEEKVEENAAVEEKSEGKAEVEESPVVSPESGEIIEAPVGVKESVGEDMKAQAEEGDIAAKSKDNAEQQ